MGRDEERYESIRESASAHNLEASRKGRDIGPPPEIVDRGRRDAAFGCLMTFLKVYFPGTFRLPWSRDHKRAIPKIQEVIEDGGQDALAMARGSGKTSIEERAAIWAVLTGRRRFVVEVAANQGFAGRSLDRIKAELERNELLFQDFPKAVYGFRRLESQSRRCVGQLCEGRRTFIGWEPNRVVFPAMPGPDNEASGAVIHVVGLEGAVRGLNYIDPDGYSIRPDLLLIDDPQDRESARSAIQTAARLAILNADLLGLTGHERKMAALAAVTVIEEDDLSDQLLDPKRFPAWRGERYQLVDRWPDQTEKWDEYGKLRAEGFLPGGDRGESATAYYLADREAMDAGAVVAWPELFSEGEHSAIQHAYNLRLDLKDSAFFAEYQNQPPKRAKSTGRLDPLAVSQRCGGFPRGVAPPEAEKLTAFIDVGGNVHWWMVCGWSEAFDCSILDYGAWPGQKGRFFTSRNADPTLDLAYPAAGGGDAAVHAGLVDLVAHLKSREWRRSDGAELKIDRLMIDSGWSTETVRLYIRQNPSDMPILPSKGEARKAGDLQVSDYRKRPGEKTGLGWILGIAGTDRLRLLKFDPNLWKDQVAAMLTRSMGVKGGVSLWGNRPIEHEMLAHHFASEYPEPDTRKGVTINQWEKLANEENHWWDCLVGCAVAASVEGLNPMVSFGGEGVKAAKRKYVTFDDLDRRRRQA